MNTLITALATPYIDGKIDVESYEKLVQYQLDSGVDGLLAVGTTAESQLLSKREKKQLIKTAKRLANDTPVWVGVGGSTPTEAIREARFAERLGADGLLIAPPAFVKCTPEGYMLHIQEILNAVSVPVMLYNAPSRTNYTLNKDVIGQLAQRVSYLKDAGRNLKYTAALSQKLKVLCGNDKVLPDMLQTGACGVVSVVSNVAPSLTRRVLNGNTEDYELFTTLSKLSMLEISPVAIKYMLYKKGIFASYDMRLPLTAANEKTQKRIDKLWFANNLTDCPQL